MKLWLVALLAVCVASVPPENWGPESGDVVADARLVVTFVENEPKLVLASPRHERHYDLELPTVTFGDTIAHLTQGKATGFFSSYERTKAETVLVLEATHPDANTTLACVMPGKNTLVKGTQVLKSMLTCNVHVYNAHMTQATEATLNLDVSSRQNDKSNSVVSRQNDTTRIDMLLEREDRHHALYASVEPIGTHDVHTETAIGTIQSHFVWNSVVPADGVMLVFDVHLSATTPNQVGRDERFIVLLLACALLGSLLVYGVGTCGKRWTLTRDQWKRNVHNAAVQSRQSATRSMLITAAGNAEMERLVAASETREQV